MDISTPEVSVAPLTKPQKLGGRHWITILSMALFVLASLGAVAFLYHQNQALKKMLANYQTVPSPSPTATADPTTNWNTYTSKLLGIAFKYPEDWNPPKEKVLENRREIDLDNKLTIASQQSLTLEEFIEKNQPTDKTSSIDYLNGNISGKKFIYRSGVDLATVDVIIAFSGQRQDVITVSFTDLPGYITKSATVDQILSTFKFLDWEKVCKEAGGAWLDKYNECEGVSLNEKFCKENGGIFSECESPCRYDPQSTICQEVCMAVCKFKQ